MDKLCFQDKSCPSKWAWCGCKMGNYTESLMELTKKEEIGQFMKMTCLSRLCYDRNQTHPVAQSLPASLASAKATLIVMTSLKSPTLLYMDPYGLNVMQCAEITKMET